MITWASAHVGAPHHHGTGGRHWPCKGAAYGHARVPANDRARGAGRASPVGATVGRGVGTGTAEQGGDAVGWAGWGRQSAERGGGRPRGGPGGSGRWERPRRSGARRCGDRDIQGRGDAGWPGACRGPGGGVAALSGRTSTRWPRAPDEARCLWTVLSKFDTEKQCQIGDKKVLSQKNFRYKLLNIIWCRQILTLKKRRLFSILQPIVIIQWHY